MSTDFCFNMIEETFLPVCCRVTWQVCTEPRPQPHHVREELNSNSEPDPTPASVLDLTNAEQEQFSAARILNQVGSPGVRRGGHTVYGDVHGF